MEIMVILVAGLLILGPKRLPEAARQVGKAMAEFRRVAGGFQAEMRDAFEPTADPPPAPPAAITPPPAPPAPLTPADTEIRVDGDDEEPAGPAEATPDVQSDEPPRT